MVYIYTSSGRGQVCCWNFSRRVRAKRQSEDSRASSNTSWLSGFSLREGERGKRKGEREIGKEEGERDCEGGREEGQYHNSLHVTYRAQGDRSQLLKKYIHMYLQNTTDSLNHEFGCHGQHRSVSLECLQIQNHIPTNHSYVKTTIIIIHK